MRKRGYGSFALPRVAAGLVIGGIVFAGTFFICEERYNSGISNGFINLNNTYKNLLERYEEGTVDEAFASIICNFYQADYIRLAKVEDDGTFDVVYETDYDVIPVEMNIHEWIYVTKDGSLITGENSHVDSVTQGFMIDYKKCDEIWTIDGINDNRLMKNAYMAISMDDGFFDSYNAFAQSVDLVGWFCYPYLEIKSYYVDDDTLYLGEVYERTEVFDKPLNGKVWYFMNDSQTYMIVTGGPAEQAPMVMGVPVRPDNFLEQEGELFLAKDLNDLSVSSTNSRKVSEFRNSDRYTASVRDNGHLTQGYIRLLDIDGQTYLMEYVLTTATFTEYYMPCLIIMAAVLLILCVGIPLLAAIKPYGAYKKTYENNEFKNSLIDSLAHNIKTPLQIIGGYAENLKDVTSEDDKNRYADSILAKTAEMNSDIEMILKTADKSTPVLSKGSVREVFDKVAYKLKADVVIKGDAQIPMDKDYLEHAVFCLIDNAARYKTKDSKIDVAISPKEIVIKNKTDRDKFTPGTGIAVAGRIIEQHGLRLKTKLEGGVFEAKITRR